MIRFLEIKNFLSLTKALKKDPPQNKTQTKEKQKTQTHLPLAFSPLLFCCMLMLVLLSSLSSSFAPKSGCFHMSHHAMKI
jgi:hypothetical protein